MDLENSTNVLILIFSAVAAGTIIVLPLLIVGLNVFRSVVVIRKGTVAVVERKGKFLRVLQPGFHVLVPFLERLHTLRWRWTETYTNTSGEDVSQCHEAPTDRIDLREQIMDFGVQRISSRDNVELMIQPVILYKLVDPVRVCYEMYDLVHALDKLMQTSLRAVVGDMSLDDTLASRDDVNSSVMRALSKTARNWGVEIVKLEIVSIQPMATIQEAMHKQLAAERTRRAEIVAAQGYREQERLKAEGAMHGRVTVSKGEQATAVLLARGTADARRKIVAAEAESVRLVGAALTDFGVEPTQYMIGMKYIETFRNIASKAARRILHLPMDTELYGALNAVHED